MGRRLNLQSEQEFVDWIERYIRWPSDFASTAALLSYIQDQVLSSGGYLEVSGGLTVGGEVQLASLIGGNADVTLTNESFSASANVNALGWNIGINIAYDEQLGLHLASPISHTFQPFPGIVIGISNITMRNGQFLKADISISMGRGVNLAVPGFPEIHAEALAKAGVVLVASVYSREGLLQISFKNKLLDWIESNPDARIRSLAARYDGPGGIFELIHEMPNPNIQVATGMVIAREAGLLNGTSPNTPVQLVFHGPDDVFGGLLVSAGGIGDRHQQGDILLNVSSGSQGRMVVESRMVQGFWEGYRDHSGNLSSSFHSWDTYLLNADGTIARSGDHLFFSSIQFEGLGFGSAPLTNTAPQDRIPANGTLRILETDPQGRQRMVIINPAPVSTTNSTPQSQDEFYTTWNTSWEQQLAGWSRDQALGNGQVVGTLRPNGETDLEFQRGHITPSGSFLVISRLPPPPASPSAPPPPPEAAWDIVVGGGTSGHTVHLAYAPDNLSVLQPIATFNDAALAEQIRALVRPLPALNDLATTAAQSVRVFQTKSGGIMVTDRDGTIKVTRGVFDSATNRSAQEVTEIVNGLVVNKTVLFTGGAGTDPVHASVLGEDAFRRDSAGQLVRNRSGLFIDDGDITRYAAEGISVTRYTSGPFAGTTRVKGPGTPLGVDFQLAGSILGSILGRAVAGDDKLVRLVSSAFFKSALGTLGGVINALPLKGESQSDTIKSVLSSFDDQLLRNLQLKGIGAVSSYLVSQLVDEIGLDGFVGDVVNTALSETLRSALANMIGIQANNIGANVGNAVGAVIGAKLASEIVTFHTVGGQLGAVIGSTVGSLLATTTSLIFTAATSTTSAAVLGLELGAFAGPVAAAIGAFVGYLLGGLIGSLFGGTPRSSADVEWDAGKGEFVVTNLYARKGGSKDLAQGMAAAAANVFNGVLNATGGVLVDPEAVQTGNYGMRMTDVVYRPTHTRDKQAITFRLSVQDKDSAGRMVGYGVYQGLTDPDLKIAGGDVYVKRALYNTFALGGVSADNFDTGIILGNIASAQQFEHYLTNEAVANSLVEAEPDSIFAAEVAIILARAVELGLNKRHESDWYGGFGSLMGEGATNAANVYFAFRYDPFVGKVSRVIGVGPYTMEDAIDVRGQTVIQGTDAGDTINLTHSANAFDLGGNLVVADNWPGHPGELPPPAGPASVAGWQNPTNLLDETEWVDLPGPDGNEAMVMQASSGGDGGNSTNAFAIDETKTYQFTFYFQYGADGAGEVRFGLSNNASAYVRDAVSGAAAADPWFFAGGAAAAGAFETGRWYKVVGYVLPESNGAIAAGSLGGVFDTVTGDKVADTNTFRWNDSRPGDSVFARFYGAGGGEGGDASTYFYRPEVHEITESAVVNGADRLASTFGLKIDGVDTDGSALSIDVAATIDAGDGDDIVHAGDMGNNVFGGAGNDTLYGGRLDDWLLGGEGNDTLDAGSATAGTLGGDGNYLDGGDGNDTIRGREGSDWLEGGEGVDDLEGGGGDDILAGGAGDGDTLHGGQGDDTYLFRLGDGDDLAEDEAESGGTVSGPVTDPLRDRLAMLAQTGHHLSLADWIGEGDWAPGGAAAASTSSGPATLVNGGEDRLTLGVGIGLDDIRLVHGGAAGSGTGADDLILELMTTDENGARVVSGDRLLMKDWFNTYKRIEWLDFADGQSVRIGDFESFVVGTPGDDDIIGTTGRDFVVGGDGNDTMHLLTGDDVGIGGAGADWVWGDEDNDLLVGGNQDDHVMGGSGNDVLSGDAGADDLDGGEGNDVLSGGLGDGDVVTGGSGSDTFRYSRGDGRDTFIDAFSDEGSWETIATLSGGVWEGNGDAGFSYDGNQLLLDGNAFFGPGQSTNGLVRVDWGLGIVTRFVSGEGGGGQLGGDANDQGVSSDSIDFGLGINIQDLMLARDDQNNLYVGISQENAEVSSFASLSDWIKLDGWYADTSNTPIEKFVFAATGVLDTDTTKLIGGGDGDDTITGTSAKEWITGNSGDDTIDGGAGDDILVGNSGGDTLAGGAGDDVLFGGAGNDIFKDGSGADIMIGGAGEDTVSYADVTASTGVAVYLSAPGVNWGTSRTVQYDGIENLTGSAASDKALAGDEGDNVITGGAGNDNLFGGAGDDTYVWNAWDYGDTIDDRPFTAEALIASDGTWLGGDQYDVQWVYTGVYVEEGPIAGFRMRLTVTNVDSGEVVYSKIYREGMEDGPMPDPVNWDPAGWSASSGFVHQLNGVDYGVGMVRQKFDDTVSGGEDTIELGEGISLTDLTFERDGADLIIRYQGNAYNFLRIKNQDAANSAVEWLQLNDGLAVSLANLQVVSSDAALNGGTQGDFLIGRDGASAVDTINGGDGDDVISGLAGNDILSGGEGADTIEGGAGADRIDGGANSAPEGARSAGDTVRYVNSTAVTVDLRNTATGQSGGDAAGDILTGIENVVGSLAGADQITGNDGDNWLSGMGGNDTLLGLGGMDVLDGGAGDDMLVGGAGEDNLVGGDGIDTLYGGDDKDFLAGGAGADVLDGGAGDDNLVGGADDDQLSGGAGDDVLDGGDGADTLVAGDGANKLIGGAGNDSLTAGAGDDLLDGGDGADTLSAGSGVNTLSGGAGDDSLTAGSGDDQLDGGDGADTLIAGDGANKLTGGAGNDVLHGGSGDDVYSFDAAMGQDQLVDGGGENKIVFGASVEFNQLWLSRTGDDLVVAIVGTTDKVTVENYFAAQNPSRIFSIATATHTLHLDNAAGLIAAMTALQTAAPAALPQAIADLLADYWLEGDNSPPTGQPIAIEIDEDHATALTGLGVVDPDGNIAGYALGGTAAAHGSVDLNAATGQFTYTPGANFHGEDSFSIVATDADGLTVEVPIAVTVHAVNDAPGAIATDNGAALHVVENAAAGTVIGQLTATDVDGDSLAYALVDDAGGRFAIGTNGQLTVGSGAGLDHETGATRTIRVRVSDGSGGTTEQDFAVAVDDANEAPDFAGTFGFTVAENVAVGTAVGSAVSATDPDDPATANGQLRYYFLNGGTASATSADGRYAIDAVTGAITVAGAIDYEAAAPVQTYDLAVRDNQGQPGFSQDTTTLQITVANLNEPAHFTSTNYPFSLDENVATGTLVGSVAALDADAAGTPFAEQRYFFLNGNIQVGTLSATTADGRYAIDPLSGAITTNGAIDFEAGPAVASYTVYARDNQGQSGGNGTTSHVTITVNNLNDAPVFGQSFSWTLDENLAAGTSAGFVTASDQDQAGTAWADLRYSFQTGSQGNETLSQTSFDGRYAIDAATGEVSLVNASDYEAGNPSQTYTVIARDNAGQTGARSVTTTLAIAINNLNEANSLAASYPFTLDENVAIGSLVGTVAAQDPDGAGSAFGEQRYYFRNDTLLSAVSADGRYAIDALTGAITTYGAIDYEAAAATTTYTVVARDNGGETGFNEAVTDVVVTVGNVNEPNHFNAASYSFSIAENSAIGAAIGAVSAWDEDSSTNAFGQQRYYFLDNGVAGTVSSDGRYLINQFSGAITANASPDYEAGSPTTQYTVVARDNRGLAGYNETATTVTVAVTDLNEAPTAVDWTPSVSSIAERDRIAAGTARPQIAIGSLAVQDPDAAGTAFNSYDFAVLDDDRFEMQGDVLVLKQDAIVDYEAGSTITLTVRATDHATPALSIDKTITLTVGDVDDVLEGDAGDNVLVGEAGRDLIYGFGGADTLSGLDGNDLLDGGAQNDVLIGGAGLDALYGGDGNDVLAGGAGNDHLYGGDNDSGATDTLYGGAGDDILEGNSGDDVLAGGAGADTLIGGDGRDQASYARTDSGVDASAGVTADLAQSSANSGDAAGDTYSGVEDLAGTAFADTLRGDDNANVIDGGGGDDDLVGRDGGDTLLGGAGNDLLHGDAGADRLEGGDGDDVIYGGAGNDMLLGGAGNDELNAESGDDTLDGGAGDDLLTGGVDNDTYIMTRASGADTIFNYEQSGTDIDVIGFQDTDGDVLDKDLWFERVAGSPNDLRISIIGTTTSVVVKDWYLAGETSLANHKIDFIIDGTKYTRTVDAEGLVDLMAGHTMPATIAARDALMDDPTYHALWATRWGLNQAPGMVFLTPSAFDEDHNLQVTFGLSDDITPTAGIQFSATVLSGSVIDAASLSWVDPGDGSRVLTIVPHSQASGTATIQVRATDAGGVSTTDQFVITVNPVADTPTITQFAGGPGTSGEAGGIALNVNVTFPDMDGSEVHEIWISDVPAGVSLSAGTFDGASGIWKLSQAQLTGLTLNAPAGWSQDLALHVTARASEAGQTAISQEAGTIVVINAPPTGVSMTNQQIAENSPNGTVVGTLSGIDPDNDPTIVTLIANPNGIFAIDAHGVLTVANSTLLNFEAQIYNNITVRITEPGGRYYDQSLTIFTTDVNEANSIPATYAFGVTENVAIGASVGTVAATDPDSAAGPYGQQRYYFLNGATAAATSSDGRFAINATTGAITTAAALDYEAFSGANYTVVARDNAGAAGCNQTSSTVTIGVTNLNEANAIPATYGFNVNENVATGTAVGTVAATDQDSAGVAYGQQRYYFSNSGTASATSADGRYTINATTGVITTAAALNYEAGTTSVAYAVIARDNAGAAGYNQVQSTVTIGINDLNEANAIPGTYSFGVNENVSVGTAVGTVAGTDLDSSGVAFGQQRYYFWSGGVANATSSDGRYTINATTGAITTAAALNYEAGTPSVAYAVIARDNAGGAGYNQVQSSVTIGIVNLNEANAIPGTYSFGVNENVSVGTAVGTVAATDIDSSGVAFGQQVYYFSNSGTASATSADGRYTINASTGAITTAAALNYEAGTPSAAYTVIARDNAGAAGYNQVSSSVTIGINNLNEQNSISNYSGAITENVAVGTIVATMVASDPDSAGIAFGQQRYYFYDGTNGATSVSWDGRFTLNATTGAITTNVAIDYESTASLSYISIVRDNAGSAGYTQSTALISFSITNLNEQNAIPSSYSFNVNENVALGTALGTVAATDPDNGNFGTQRYYFWNGTTASSVSSDGRYFMTAANGVITANTGALNYEGGSPSASYTVIARDNVGDVGYNQVATTVTIGINNLNEANAIPASYSFGVNENVGVGTAVGTVAASDADSSGVAFGQQVYYFWNGSSASATSSDGRYAINATTGAITTAAALNYEAGTTSVAYTVIARDNAGAAGYNQVSSTVTIGIADVNEANSIPGSYSFGVNENVGVGTAVGTVAATDPDSAGGAFGQQRYYFWNGSAFVSTSTDGRYALNATTGAITTASALNYEAGSPSVAYTVYALDNAGAAGYNQAASTVTIGINNVNEAPTASNSGTTTFQNTATTNALVGSISASDPDAGTTYTYSIVSVTNANGGTGTVSDYRLYQAGGNTATVNTLHAMGSGTYKNKDIITVRVTDQGGLWYDTTFAVVYNNAIQYQPIVLDLDGDGVELVSSLTSNVYVDMNRDGVKDRTGWVGADDAFLALDRNGDGIVTDVGEISFVGDLPGAVSDLEGLAAHDTNQNGIIDSGDADYASFMVWQDSNQDGVSQASELRSLAQAGIVSIGLTLNRTGQDPATADDNVLYSTSEYALADGTSRQVGDVMLSYVPTEAQLAPPVILDLDGDGVTTTDLIAGAVQFDMDGDGVKDSTGWVGVGDGILALDRNKDGIINDLSEISFVADLAGARTDLEGLVAFDTNHDGRLSAADARFGDFRIWVDANHDGVTDTGELKKLPELGILSISLDATATGDPTVNGRNVVYNESTFLRADGTTGTVGDVGLSFVGSATNGIETTGTNQVVPDDYRFDRKSKNYAIETKGGRIFIQPRKVNGMIDPAVGGVASAASLLFKDGAMGFGAAVVLDLDGDGIELKKRKKSDAHFDMNGDGVADDTGWVNKSDGILVLDRNGNGIVDGTGEMSFVGDLPGAKSGLEGLSAFDTNRDGLLDANDEKYGSFRIWQDLNGNGRSDAGEMKTLDEAGIASIGLGGRANDGKWKRDQNIILNTGTFTRADGSTGTVGDVALSYKPSTAPQSDAQSAIDDRLSALRAGLDRWMPPRWSVSEQGFDFDVAAQGDPSPVASMKLTGRDTDLPTARPDSVAKLMRSTQMPTAADNLQLAVDGQGPITGGDEPSAFMYHGRMAFLVQQMASFGGRSGESGALERSSEPRHYDYFAA